MGADPDKPGCHSFDVWVGSRIRTCWSLVVLRYRSVRRRSGPLVIKHSEGLTADVEIIMLDITR